MTALRIRAEPLTVGAFRPFGLVMEAPKDGNRTGPLPVIADPRPTAKVTATLIDLLAQTSPRPIRQIERHLNSAQFFLHLSGGSLSLVVFRRRTTGRRISVQRVRSWQHPDRRSATIRAHGMRAWPHWVPGTSRFSSQPDGTPDDVDESPLAETIEVDWT